MDVGNFGKKWARMGNDWWVWICHSDRVGMGDISNGLVCVHIQVQVWIWMNVATFWHIYNSR